MDPVRAELSSDERGQDSVDKLARLAFLLAGMSQSPKAVGRRTKKERSMKKQKKSKKLSLQSKDVRVVRISELDKVSGGTNIALSIFPTARGCY